MAIDNEQKRKSVPSVMRFGRPRAIVPSGAFAQADRQQIGWGWAGILAAPVTPIVERGKLIDCTTIHRTTRII